MTKIHQGIEALCDDVIGTRPEEFAADDFANQHATKETLQAAHHLYSKKGFIDRQYFDFVQDFTTHKNIQTMGPEAQKVMFKFAQYLNSSERFLLSSIYNLRGLLAPSHPSPSRRQHIVDQALKDRFGIDASNLK